MGSQTEPIPYEEIVAQLSPDDRIAVITCNTCVRIVGVGGTEIMRGLAKRLREDGFIVTDEISVTTACHYDYVARAPLREDATAAVVLACEVGWMAVVQRLDGRKIVRGAKTTGLMSSVPKTAPRVPTE